MESNVETGYSIKNDYKENTKKISRAASIVGLTVIGALIASYINFKLGITINAGDITVELQEGVLDKIMPKLLPLLYTFFCYKMLKKGKSPLMLIFITVVIGILGSFLNIF